MADLYPWILKPSRRYLFKAAVALTSVAAASTACTSDGRAEGGPPPSPNRGGAPSRPPLRTRRAPFVGAPPRVMYLRGEPLDLAAERWLMGAHQQAALAGIELVHDEASIDGPTLVNALRATVANDATSGVIIEGDSVGGATGLPETLAAAAAAGIPVVAQSSAPSLDVAGTVLVDDEQLMRQVLASTSNFSGRDVGYVAPMRGYARLDRRGDVWATVRDESGWAQVFLSEEAAASLSPVPDDGVSTRIVSAELISYPEVALIGAPNAFLLATVGSACGAREGSTVTDLVGVVDSSEFDIDVTSLRGPGVGQVTVGIVDPKQLGAVTVRAMALLIAGDQEPGTSTLVPGQIVTRDDLRSVDARRLADLFSHLLARTLPPEALPLTAPWLPAL